MTGDHFSLCGECGTISHVDAFEYLTRDLDTDRLRPTRLGEQDPVIRCPICRYDHRDDDTGCLWSGTFAQMNQERADCLNPVGRYDYDYSEDWQAVHKALSTHPTHDEPEGLVES